MSEVLKGKVAVVVGSGQGIGRAIAIGMAQEGVKAVTNNRRPGGTGIGLYSEPIITRMLTKFDNTPWTQEELAAQVPRGLLQG